MFVEMVVAYTAAYKSSVASYAGLKNKLVMMNKGCVGMNGIIVVSVVIVVRYNGVSMGLVLLIVDLVMLS